MVNTSFDNVLELFQYAVAKYPDRTAFSCMGVDLSYAEVDRQTLQFARYLQNHTGLSVGDRIAIQLPNIPQFPIVFYGAIRAGLTVVNVNPLYTPREIKHQLCDSGAKTLVVLANVAHSAATIIRETQVEKVIVTELADFMPQPKRFLVNTVVRYIKKMVRDFEYPAQESYLNALRLGRAGDYTKPQPSADDILVLQYTGGTTGLSKGAILSHKNLCANVNQVIEHLPEFFGFEPELFAAPLPFYHIYAFNLHLLCAFYSGSESMLIPNPRDIPAFVKALKAKPVTIFIGLNTLFIALCRDQEFATLDFSRLKATSAGGMALTADGARQWKRITGTDVCEGYGLTETSPVVSSNRPGDIVLGSIGKPVPNTQVKVVDENGANLASGEVGELCVKGPQVMRGYWQQPEETEKVFLAEGWLRTGDMATIDDQGYIRLVDRKKDMIIVSGFNVYPNEIENVATEHPDIIEAAAVGIDDEGSGQIVKLFVVRGDESLTEEAVIAFCKKSLTAYKVPKIINFKDELPKSNVGKILRRKLRDLDD